MRQYLVIHSVLGCSSSRARVPDGGGGGTSSHPLLGAVDNPVNRFCDDFASSLIDETPKKAKRGALSGRPEFDDITGFTVKRVLGSGAEATVYEAVRDRTSTPVAVKKYNVVKNMDNQVPREVVIAGVLNHPRCARVVDTFTTASGAFAIVMPLAVGGSLKITDAPELTWIGGVVLLQQISSALAHMHSLGVVHRDVKPGNILMSDDGYILCDFSISTQLQEGDEMVAGVLGTSVFMAPEIGVSMYLAKPVDVWALGVTVFGLVYGRYPWTLEKVLDNMTGVMNGQNCAKNEISGDLEFPEVPAVPNELKDIISGMLERDPARRLTAQAVAENPWLAEQTEQWERMMEYLGED